MHMDQAHQIANALPMLTNVASSNCLGELITWQP